MICWDFYFGPQYLLNHSTISAKPLSLLLPNLVWQTGAFWAGVCAVTFQRSSTQASGSGSNRKGRKALLDCQFLLIKFCFYWWKRCQHRAPVKIMLHCLSLPLYGLTAETEWKHALSPESWPPCSILFNICHQLYDWAHPDWKGCQWQCSPVGGPDTLYWVL